MLIYGVIDSACRYRWQNKEIQAGSTDLYQTGGVQPAIYSNGTQIEAYHNIVRFTLDSKIKLKNVHHMYDVRL